MTKLCSDRVQKRTHTQTYTNSHTHKHTHTLIHTLDLLDDIIHIEENKTLKQKKQFHKQYFLTLLVKILFYT